MLISGCATQTICPLPEPLVSNKTKIPRTLCLDFPLMENKDYTEMEFMMYMNDVINTYEDCRAKQKILIETISELN